MGIAFPFAAVVQLDPSETEFIRRFFVKGPRGFATSRAGFLFFLKRSFDVFSGSMQTNNSRFTTTFALGTHVAFASLGIPESCELLFAKASLERDSSASLPLINFFNMCNGCLAQVVQKFFSVLFYVVYTFSRFLINDFPNFQKFFPV